MTIEEVAELITRRCPGSVVDSIDFFGEGDFCVAYLINNEWVFRFAKHKKAAASLRREACLLPKIADRFDVRIPSPQLVNADRAPTFMVYAKLPGASLTRERYSLLPESNRERCAIQVATFLSQMHTSDVALAWQCGVEVTDYVAQYGEVLARARKHLFVKLAESDRVFVEQAVAAYLQTEAFSDFRPALLHGDLSPDHVLYAESTASVSGIIDFGDMVIADPAWDLALIYEDYGPEFLKRLLRVYGLGERNSLLERMYHFYVLAAIEWAVGNAEHSSVELADAIARLSRLRMTGEQEFQELRSACVGS